MQTLAVGVSALGSATLVAGVARRARGRLLLRSSEGEQEVEMTYPQIVSRAEWVAARKALLVQEKEATRRRDALAGERRRLPMVEVDKAYVFDGPTGPMTLLDLFDGRRQLIVYHFMFDPSWEEGCKSCSCFMDNAEGAIVHLTARDTTFAVVSRAPLSKIEPFRTRMGWNFLWVSSNHNTFNADFAVTVDVEGAEGSREYNYESAATLLKAGKIWSPKGELPGMSVFLRNDDRVFHTYSAYQRGLDQILNMYNLLDLTPLGRQEENDRSQSWIRHHDRYPGDARSLNS
jgi:predicted dithiol-disulfide oxidoreductase (DUF899 family)